MIGGTDQVWLSQRRASVELHGACVPALTVLLLYVATAALLYPHDYNTLLVQAIAQTSVFNFVLAAILLYADAWCRAPRAPARIFVQTLRERGTFVALGVLVFVVGLTAFTTYKVNIPNIMPFYADPHLARIDRFLHGGVPWNYVYVLPPAGAGIIDFFYTKLWPVALVVGYLAAFALLRGRAFLRYVWSFMFVYMVLGGLIAVLGSSVGPIFYSDFYAPTPEFDRLRDTVLANDALGDIRLYTAYLLDNYRSDGPALGTGISAFPSVHVAIATLTAWLLTSQGRVCAVFGWMFYAIIEYGSIYTGWHYAIGGYFSTIAVSLVWIGLSRYYGLPLMPRPARYRANVAYQD